MNSLIDYWEFRLLVMMLALFIGAVIGSRLGG